MWLLLVTMAAVAAVQGAQYGDYGAAKMPAYGEYEVPRDPPQDYHLPSAPASPELLDEVDNKVITQKSLSKDYAFDSWHKPSRKQSKRARNDDDFLERRNRDNGGQKYREDDDRIQSKTENSRDIRARVKHKRDQTREKDDEEFSIEKYIRGINENNLEADVARSNRKTTDRVIHRKARDRDMQVGAAFKESDFDEDLNSNRFKNHVPNPDLREIEDPIDEIRSDDEAGLQSGSESRSGAQPIDRRQGDPSRRRGYDDPPRLRPAQRARLEAGSDKPGDYDTDYYDVKRLQSMRKKVLPPRRFYQAREEDWASSPLENIKELDYRRMMNANKRRTTNTRRSTTSPWTMTTTPVPATTTTSISPNTTAALTPSTSSIVTTSSEPSLTPTSKTDKKELSLAEKSRLSIMKKAGLKERQKGGPPTTKPPVLLQVTKMIPTVILVEASTTADPWLRARDVHEDSPEHLARVRQLMRNKLVANAKDIRDLTEDWDQLICDYVDVGLLKNRALLFRPNATNIILIVCSLCMFA